MAQSINDALAVLDALQWSRALIVGHSWGGHLALRLAAAHPERLLGALAVDPLGVVGDGGMADLEAEIVARTPKEDRERARKLDERAMAGETTPEEALESLKTLWPAHFADPENAPPMPPVRRGLLRHSRRGHRRHRGVAAALAAGEVPYGVIAGAEARCLGVSPRARAPSYHPGVLTIVPAAGHFPRLEAPSCVRAALQRLTG